MDIVNISKDELIEITINLIDKNLPLVSNLANLSKLLYDSFSGTNWCGFYICYENKNMMYLGPFQGPIACTEIPFSKGVCGKAVTSKESILVPNVHNFSGHIACCSSTNSEVVVPIIKDSKVVGVIDLDSNNFNNYTNDDVILLEKVANLISTIF